MRRGGEDAKPSRNTLGQSAFSWFIQKVQEKLGPGGLAPRVKGQENIWPELYSASLCLSSMLRVNALVSR